MKKIILASTALIVIGGLVFSIKGVGAKSFEKKNSFEVDRIEEVEINNESWDIEFKNTKSKKITIEVEGKQKDKKNDPVTITNDGKKIEVNQKDQKGIFEGFSFGKKGTIYISIPNNEVDTITLNNSFGDIKMNDVTTKNIVISNDSGAEKIEGLSAVKGKFTSKDGELSLKDSSLKELTVDSNTGDNYLTSVTSPKMKITSTDGEVSIKGVKEGKSLFVETKSGDISVSYKKAPTSLKLTANSDSSDITVDLDSFKKKTNTEKSKEGTIGDASNKLELLSKDGVINVK
ncbi:DUF4097 family beta strand repeat-containing protein [Bacillus sp. DX1.1]|uniref:DUF4097 family beta strand repeat-containing protein n=1 Tax=unclassified Bacillus (in: firmicutes) TaxID=185979 RepID=UPI00257080D0|nr:MULTISPECIES: DUF4097 family beta strand repeat-containing protein [unclassified Bacillus (in: firmicutes)]MDM5157185.1 DUF4097 family beta strand repeat-containing protein [Bacillus sp. DX1.1]WJE81416.1 DUF4097 family beta strand repeat-containing protein [Bacillus sp. DX3.1]